MTTHSSPPNRLAPTPSSTLTWSLLIMALLGVIALHMPWHNHAVAAFRLNAFDLAEWISLHPTTRSESPALWSSMLLRLPFVLLGGIIALVAGYLRDERWRWIWRLVAILIVLRLNPPVAFYQSPTGVSENEQQLGQLMLGGLAVVIGMMLVGGGMPRLRLPLVLLGWLVILYASWEGLRRATGIVESLQIDVTYAAGIYTIMLLGLVSLGLGLRQLVIQKG